MTKINLENGLFFIFDAPEDSKFEQIYFSSEEKLKDHIDWWLKNRTDSFQVFSRKFEE